MHGCKYIYIVYNFIPTQVEHHVRMVVRTAGTAPPAELSNSAVQELASKADKPSHFLM